MSHTTEELTERLNRIARLRRVEMLGAERGKLLTYRVGSDGMTDFEGDYYAEEWTGEATAAREARIVAIDTEIDELLGVL